MRLPHTFPFRFVDRASDERAVVRVSADSWWSRGATAHLSVTLLAEAVAQSAALLLAPDETEPRRLVLAAIERASVVLAPAPGDDCDIRVEVLNRFGGLVRVRGIVRVERAEVGEAIVVLAAG